MSEAIQFTVHTLNKLFQNFYVVPEYQREYVWGEKEVNQLMNDLYGHFKNSPKSEYFLGSLVVCKLEDTHKYEVIDGQQRLITLSLLLNNLRQIYIAVGGESSVIERLLYDSHVTETGETVKSHIVEVQYEGKNVLYDLFQATNDKEVSQSSEVDGLPGETIYNAYKSIAYYLETASDKDDRVADTKRFLGFLLNKVKLIQIQTPDIGNALNIFETINERGIGLDQVDLLKNLLFIQTDRKKFDNLKNEWDKFKKSIVGKKTKEKPLRFLRYFIMANYDVGTDPKGVRILREGDIYQWFVDNEKICGYKSDPFEFIRKIQESAGFYINLIQSRYRNKNNTNLENIHSLVGKGFKQHLILLLSAKSLEPAFFDHLLKQLEVLLFYYNITKEPPRDIEKRFTSWANEIRNIKSLEDLNDFIDNRIKEDIRNRKSTFKFAFLNLNYNSLQKYKLKYILGKLSAYVDSSRLGDRDVASLGFYLKSTIHIEHILPDVSTEELVNNFDAEDKKEYDEYKQKLGNLTLLERAINTSIKRDFFSEKCRGYEKSQFYLTCSIPGLVEVGIDTSFNRVNQHLKSFQEWNKSSVDMRQEMLYEIAKLTWQVDSFTQTD